MLNGKSYIVTGASSGIGKAITQSLLALGANVLGIGRHVKTMESQNNFQAIEIDFEKPQLYENKIKELVRSLGEINGCICAAGVGRFGALEQFSFAQMQSIMHINFTAHSLLVRHVIPNLKQQKSGDIIFIGSEAALDGGRNGAMYCASKFALRGFALSLREECSKSGLRVSLINPGMVKTPFFKDLHFKPGDDEVNYVIAEDVANAVKLILTSREGTVFDEIVLSPLKKVIKFNT